MPTKSKYGGKRKADIGLPEFKPDALASLAKRIQESLGKSGLESKENVKRRVKEQKEKDQSNLPSTTLPSSDPTSPTSARQVTYPEKGQGKKRLRNGEDKRDKSEYKAAQERPDNRTIIPKTGNDAQTRFRDDILALGGTEEDYRLIQDAGSDSEIEGITNRNANSESDGLKKDLLSLVNEPRAHKTTNAMNGKIQWEPENDGNHAQHPSRTQKAVFHGSYTSGVKPAHIKVNSGSTPRLKFQPRSAWHTVSLPALPLTSKPEVLPAELLENVHEHAKSLLKIENNHYGSQNRTSSSAREFYMTIMSSGTLSDKISALTLSVQESPLHNMRALENLVGLAGKRSRGQAVEVLGALKDLLGPGTLLPSDRKLKAFGSQPGLAAVFGDSRIRWTDKDPVPAPLEEVHLLIWAYEDWLKTTYFEILKIIETWCNDEVVFARGKAVDYVFELLKDKPEQEANLLRLLINKLGDSDKKIASKTSYNILQLENTHPLMKTLIVSSVESDLIFRPNQSLHAQYYAIITLNQTILSNRDDILAKKLLDIYFTIFLKLLAKPEAKPLSSGANAVTVNRKGDIQGGGGAVGKKARQKQALKEKRTVIDEEFREKTIAAVLTGINRAMPFTNTDDETFEKHLDTLFRVTHSSNFNTSIQALMLIQQLSGSHPGIVDRYYRTLYESLLDPRLLTSSKQAMFLNLLFKSLRTDLSIRRVQAFAKRLLQVAAMHQPSFACGVLYLLKELKSVFTNLATFIDQPKHYDSDEEEIFKDVREGDDNDRKQVDRPQVEDTKATMPASRYYDGRKRDPEYCNVEGSCLWEITPFVIHFHPSVALFSSKLTTHDTMPEKPDLELHTLIHFLDRFVYRNPKKNSIGPRGSSIMQPMAGGDISGLLIAGSTKTETQPVNTEAFWKKESAKIDADKVFFHHYFNTVGKGKKTSGRKKVQKDPEDSGGEDEEEIWKALADSRPEIEASDESDEGFDEDEVRAITNASDEDVDANVVESLDEDAAEDGALDLEDDGQALLGSDDEVPSDLDEAFKKEVQFNARKVVEVPEDGKGNKKRRKLKNLPTFASAEDYAIMLDADEEDYGSVAKA